MDVKSLAAAFIGEYGSNGNISNLKLNKLLYLTYAIELRTGKKLFASSPFEAWDYGPVAPEVYRTYKHCGSKNIYEPLFEYGNEEIEVSRRAWDRYGDLTAFDLVEMTHRKNGAWQKVREEGRTHIDDEDILNSDDGKLDKLDFENTLGRISNKVDTDLADVYKWLENR